MFIFCNIAVFTLSYRHRRNRIVFLLPRRKEKNSWISFGGSTVIWKGVEEEFFFFFFYRNKKNLFIFCNSAVSTLSFRHRRSRIIFLFPRRKEKIFWINLDNLAVFWNKVEEEVFFFFYRNKKKLLIFDNLALSWKEGRRRNFLLLLSKEEEYVFSTNILVMQMEEEEIFF